MTTSKIASFTHCGSCDRRKQSKPSVGEKDGLDNEGGDEGVDEVGGSDGTVGVGEAEGEVKDGVMVGTLAVGALVGELVVGCSEGLKDGLSEWCVEGEDVGSKEGIMVG